MRALTTYVELPRVDPDLVSMLREAGARAVAVPVFSQRAGISTVSVEDVLDEIRRIGDVEGISKGISVGDMKPLEAEEWDVLRPYAGDFLFAPAAGLPVRTLNSIGSPVYVYVQGGLPLEQYRALSQITGIRGLIYVPAASYREGARFNVLDLAAIGVLRSLVSGELLVKVGEYITPAEAEMIVKFGVNGIVIEPPADSFYENEEVVSFVRGYLGIRAGEGYTYLG